MNAPFLKLLNMGLTASWLVLAVLLLRILLKKAPKWTHCLLWAIVAVRLVLPVTFESSLSLVPSGEVIPADIAVTQTPAIHSGITSLNSVVNPAITQQVIRQADPQTNPMEFVFTAAAVLWAVGVVVMLIYSGVSYLLLRRRVRVSVETQPGVYLCDEVDAAFILGVFRPKIYVSSSLGSEHLSHVLAHEYAHLSRRDHIWKPLAFLLLSIYWFNPLLWLAYILLCRDIESACDEKVVSKLDSKGIVAYSEALLVGSTHRKMVMVCPVAFGEVSAKERIRGVLSYKKPAFWVVMAASLACLVTAVCFLTNPIPCAHAYEQTETVPATCAQRGMQTLCCQKCGYTCAEPLHMTAHTYDGGVVTVAPNCLHTGTRLYTCIDCGAEKTEELPLTGHTAGEKVGGRKPNCIQEGEVHSKCSVCDKVFVSEILPPNDTHDLVERVVRESTCTTEGEGIRECTRCDYSESCTYERTGHQLYQVTEGRNVLVKCKVCNGVMQSTPIFFSSTDKPVDGYDITGSGVTGGIPQMPTIKWDIAQDVVPQNPVQGSLPGLWG